AAQCNCQASVPRGLREDNQSILARRDLAGRVASLDHRAGTNTYVPIGWAPELPGVPRRTAIAAVVWLTRLTAERPGSIRCSYRSARPPRRTSGCEKPAGAWRACNTWNTRAFGVEKIIATRNNRNIDRPVAITSSTTTRRYIFSTWS